MTLLRLTPTEERVLSLLRQGGVARLSEESPGLVCVDGEIVCARRDIVSLLRKGAIEVAGPTRWRAPICPLCRGPISNDFRCCEEAYV